MMYPACPASPPPRSPGPLRRRTGCGNPPAAGFTLRRAGAVCGLPWAWLCNGRPVARRPGCEMALPLSEPGRIAARLEQGWVGADLRPGPAGENLLLYPAGPLL